jgi:putative oxidoreductase
MTNLSEFQSQWSPRVLSVFRFVTGFLFVQHGAQKLFGFLAAQPGATPPLLSMAGVAGVLEFFGGLLILVGLFTRPAAFILSGLMAVAYFLVHAPQGFWTLQNQGELAVLYSFVFLFFSVAGGGEWSLDRLLNRNPSTARGVYAKA